MSSCRCGALLQEGCEARDKLLHAHAGNTLLLKGCSDHWCGSDSLPALPPCCLCWLLTHPRHCCRP
jgi:hypothetical protein